MDRCTAVGRPVSSGESLDTDHTKLTRCHRSQRVENRRSERCEHGERVAIRLNDNDPYPTAAQVLLIAEPLIGGNERVVLGLGGIEERPVIEIRPPSLVNRVHDVPREMGGEATRQVAVEQDAHAARPALRGGRVGDERLLGELQNGDGVLARDTGEILEELIQGMPSLQVLDQRLHWNACSGKHRRPPETIGRSGNQGRGQSGHRSGLESGCL